jgi:hypothetical protein
MFQEQEKLTSGGLALGLEEDGQVEGVRTIPGVERLKELEAIGGRGDSDVDGGAVLRRGLVGVYNIKSVLQFHQDQKEGVTHSCL